MDSLTALVDDLRASLADPARRHAIAIHTPLVLSALGVPVAVLTLILRRRSARIFAVCFFVAFSASALLAVRSGEDAEAALPAHLSETAGALLDQHADLAERLWIGGLAVAALFALALAPLRILGFGARLLGLLGAIGLAGWTGIVGHYGGSLVYEHGVGTRPWRDGGARVQLAPALIGTEPAGASGVIALASSSAAAPPGEADLRVAFFAQSIAPLLAGECLSCHGSRRRGGLDMRSLDGLLAVGRSKRPAVVPGSPDESLLIEVVRGEHFDIEQMPPDEPLDDAEIALLVRWILEGAVWDAPSITERLEQHSGRRFGREGHEPS